MLKQIKLSNFRSFSKTEVDIKNINVLIGGNGSGKSNFISLFSMLNYIYIGRLRNWITNKGGFDNLVYNGIQENESISLSFFFDTQSSNVYDLSLRATEEDYIVDAEKFGSPIHLVTPYFDDFILEPEPNNPSQIIDEPELGLHPLAISLLAERILPNSNYFVHSVCYTIKSI